MQSNYQNKYYSQDFSKYEWSAFIPSDTIVDDLSVLKFHGDLSKLSLPESFSIATYTLQFITQGSWIAHVNNQDSEMGPNSGVFTSPDFLLKPPTANTYIEAYILCFSQKFARELNPPFSLAQMAQIYARPVWRMSEEKTRRAVQFLELLRDLAYDKNRASALQLIRSFLLYLAGEYAYDLPAAPQLSRNEEITGRFLALVDSNCEQHHALDWYASELCLSTRYMANTIKDTLGFTASEAIERALMQRAKTLLTTSTAPIAEIAETLGFLNQSHFGTFFKRHAGCSPKQFRSQ